MPRSLRQILALPQTDAEERFADQHIRQAAAAIREGWSDDERFRRQVTLPPGAWIPPLVEFISTLDGDGDGDQEPPDAPGDQKNAEG